MDYTLVNTHINLSATCNLTDMYFSFQKTCKAYSFSNLISDSFKKLNEMLNGLNIDINYFYIKHDVVVHSCKKKLVKINFVQLHDN